MSAGQFAVFARFAPKNDRLFQKQLKAKKSVSAGQFTLRNSAFPASARGAMPPKATCPYLALRIFYSDNLNWGLALFFFAPFASFFALRSSFVPPSLLGRRTSPGVVQTRGLNRGQNVAHGAFSHARPWSSVGKCSSSEVSEHVRAQFRGVRARSGAS